MSFTPGTPDVSPKILLYIKNQIFTRIPQRTVPWPFCHL
jgi:hypothetical protein